MGIGLGIVLVVIGLILVLDVVDFDISFVDDTALGWILLVVGHPRDRPRAGDEPAALAHHARRGAPLRRPGR